MNYNKFDLGTHKSVTSRPFRPSVRGSRAWAISHRAVAPLAIAFDALTIFATSMLSCVAYNFETIGSSGNLAQFGCFASVVAVLFIALGKNRDLYELTELLNLKSQIREITISWVFILLFLTGVAFTMKVGGDFSRGATLGFAIFGLAALVSERILWRIFLADGLAVRKFSGREVMLIEEESSGAESGLLEAFARHGLQLSNHFVLPADWRDLERGRAVISHAISSARGSSIQEIIVSASLDHWSELRGLLSQLRVLPIPVNLVPVGPLSELLKVPSHMIGDTLTIELQRGPRTFLQRSVKRIFDFVIAVTALVLLIPLLLMTAIAIKLDSSGPIIFRQRRSGFNGKQFQIFKFRTMLVLEDGETIRQAQPNDSRVTRIGHWLRRTSIDELPQLINVIRGDMSIVGPRPHAVAHDNQFDKMVSKYAYRHHVKPGLTGWAQVNGHRGEMHTVADIEDRVRLDLWYIDNWNFATDFKIILMTAIEVFRGQNAY